MDIQIISTKSDASENSTDSAANNSENIAKKITK